MTNTTQRAAAALELLPEELREPAVAYLLEQAEKFRALQQDVGQGLNDARTGRVHQWDFAGFLRKASSIG